MSALKQLNLAAMVKGGEFQRVVYTALERQAKAAGADLEDVQQDVAVEVLRAQGRPRARYDAERGSSPTSYVYMLAKTRGAHALRAPSRARTREVDLDDADRHSPACETTAEGVMARVMALLDSDEERVMAMHLAAGCTLVDIQRLMSLSESRASELRTRVRLLLLPLRGELDGDEG